MQHDQINPPPRLWFNLSFMLELEDDLKVLSDHFVNTQYVIMWDTNGRVGFMQIKLQQMWDYFDVMDKDLGNYQVTKTAKIWFIMGKGRSFRIFVEEMC